MSNCFDRFDRTILFAIQKNNQFTMEELGQQVGLSKSAVQRRLACIRKSKLIEAEVAVLNPDELGAYLTFILVISLKKADEPETMSQAMTRFSEAIDQYDEVQQCYHVTGATDYFAVVNVRDKQHFAKFTKALLYDNLCIDRFESSLVVDRIKVGLTYPFFE